ncbi:glycosyltransferase [Salinimicrobium sp. TIG7-5_MAKvit]|uniref:glycosyltransferase n=1 Tax=Salinimicrobium sp. TIG7-5_MAKvit TaxID=3121289 RepID=UPI003C6DC53E
MAIKSMEYKGLFKNTPIKIPKGSMKVLYIIDSLKAYGAEKSLALLASSFKDVEPVFISLNSNLELQPFLESKGIKVYSGIEKDAKSKKNLLKKITKIVKKEKPSIIHSTLFKSDSISRNLKRKFPEIILVGSLVSNSYSKNRYKTLSIFSKLKLFTTQMQDRFSVRKVDHFISNSQAIVESNSRALRIPGHKINIIHRGRSLPKINAGDKTKLKECFQDKKVFITVGRLCKNKGQMDLVKAFKKMDLRALNLALLIVGDGPDYKSLKAEIESSGLEDHIELMGYRKDVDFLYQLSDYFIFPSYFEGLPGALIEAIMAKIPCLVSDIPENRECFPEGGGVYFKAGDIQGIKNKIEESLKIENWEERVDSNYKFAVNSFSLDLAAERYEEFYFDIVKPR